LSWSTVWKLYRELTRLDPEDLSPSGADLITQWQGGVIAFDRASMKVTDLSQTWDLSALMVFSATELEGRKVATHHHLDGLRGEGWCEISRTWTRTLGNPLSQGLEAAQRGDLASLGSAMDRYAGALGELGLEVPAAAEDREALRKIPGVLGVKGAGALQSDAVLVLVDSSHASAAGIRAQVREVARAHGLKLVCDGLSRQEGVTGHAS
jgi:hypothetical protein